MNKILPDIVKNYKQKFVPETFLQRVPRDLPLINIDFEINDIENAIA